MDCSMPVTLSVGFPRQEYWSALPVPSPESLPDSGIESVSPAWQADSLPLSYLGSPNRTNIREKKSYTFIVVIIYYWVTRFSFSLLTKILLINWNRMVYMVILLTFPVTEAYILFPQDSVAEHGSHRFLWLTSLKGYWWPVGLHLRLL